MNVIVTKLLKFYDVVLDVIFILLLLFTAFVICYYCLPAQTSEIIAKALSYTDNPELATTFMNYLNGFTLGAGFPLWFSQKAMTSRYVGSVEAKYGYKSTQEILAENLKLAEIQVEFQKAEALRFSNSPTMPAKARLHYKQFLKQLDERNVHIDTLKDKLLTKKELKAKKKKPVPPTDKLDGLI